jgi:hypothetical protein
MIDVNQRLENDIPGADQVLLNVAEQVHFTSIPFTRGSRQAISAAGGLNKRARNSVYSLVLLLSQMSNYFLPLCPQ